MVEGQRLAHTSFFFNVVDVDEELEGRSVVMGGVTVIYSSWSVYSCLAVLGLAAALYMNNINGDFVFDDHEAIENNIDVRYLVLVLVLVLLVHNIFLMLCLPYAICWLFGASAIGA